jgi:hypothetical protein
VALRRITRWVRVIVFQCDHRRLDHEEGHMDSSMDVDVKEYEFILARAVTVAELGALCTRLANEGRGEWQLYAAPDEDSPMSQEPLYDDNNFPVLGLDWLPADEDTRHVFVRFGKEPVARTSS